MTPGRTPSAPAAAGLFALAVLLGISGCQGPHQVKVDAISHPRKVPGSAYVLDLRDPVAGSAPEVRAQALAEIRAALAARGLYESPAGAQPDLLVQCEYGVGPGHMIIEYKPRDMLAIDYWGKLPPNGGATPVLVYDKFLKLTAREPARAEPSAVPPSRPASSPTSPPSPLIPGEELWSVHLTIEDPRNELAPYLPVLATASVNYIAANPGAEIVVKLPRRAGRAGR